MARIDWSEEIRPGWTKEDELREVCKEEISLQGYNGYLRRVSDRMGVSFNAIASKVRHAPWYGELQMVRPEVKFQNRTEEQVDKSRVQLLEAELRAAVREKALGDKLVEVIQATTPQLPPIITKPWTPPKKPDATIETVLLFLSDWHAFEEVSPERTRGINEYSPEVMAERAGRLIGGCGSIIDKMGKGGWSVPECVIALGGDFVSGTIHELERHAHGTNIVLATQGIAWLLGQMIRTLSGMFQRVYVFGVGGNHGRLPDARRKQHKDPTRTWDYMTYLMVSQMLEGHDNVQCWFPDCWSAQVNIRGWNFLLNHGDDIKAWGGNLPWYGMARRTGKLLALEGARQNVIHYQLLGHFHQSLSMPHPAGETFVNGSAIGATEYSIDTYGDGTPPHQWMLMVHQDRGVTSRWPLRLDLPQDDIPKYVTTPWLEVQRSVNKMGTVPQWKVETS